MLHILLIVLILTPAVIMWALLTKNNQLSRKLVFTAGILSLLTTLLFAYWLFFGERMKCDEGCGEKTHCCEKDSVSAAKNPVDSLSRESNEVGGEKPVNDKGETK